MTMFDRSTRGRRNNLAGHAAEDAVARHYRQLGHQMAAQNWRGQAGEVDLIAREGDRVVFIEVKKAATHAQAALSLGSRQMARIYAAASEFLGGEPKGELTEARFDVALVDALGRIEILENAFAA
jgi:putative endonuclease